MGDRRPGCCRDHDRSGGLTVAVSPAADLAVACVRAGLTLSQDRRSVRGWPGAPGSVLFVALAAAGADPDLIDAVGAESVRFNAENSDGTQVERAVLRSAMLTLRAVADGRLTVPVARWLCEHGFSPARWMVSSAQNRPGENSSPRMSDRKMVSLARVYGSFRDDPDFPFGEPRPGGPGWDWPFRLGCAIEDFYWLPGSVADRASLWSRAALCCVRWPADPAFDHMVPRFILDVMRATGMTWNPNTFPTTPAGSPDPDLPGPGVEADAFDPLLVALADGRGEQVRSLFVAGFRTEEVLVFMSSGGGPSADQMTVMEALSVPVPTGTWWYGPGSSSGAEA